MKTETTAAYNRLDHLRDDEIDTGDLLDLFQPGELEGANAARESWNRMDRGKLRNILQRQLSGNPDQINPELCLNQQVGILSYDPKLEIDRDNFSVKEMLGSGNFGAVFVGEAHGLLHPGSVTKVAIKTTHDAFHVDQMSSLMCEMKILTNLDLHLNLVNLLGSCTSEMEDAKLWLLLEYCPHGDLKSFLISHRQEFRNNIKGLLVATEHNARLFLKWAHSIAKGMAYLSSKKIMHGDLAARNILLGAGLVAKVGDFGLSKSMYDNVRYRKQQRNLVPWKWMAVEFLKDGCFTLKSDVWSYGVVLWEMLSLGQEPYASSTANGVDDAVDRIKAGHRLDLPEDAESIDWASRVYDDVMTPSWNADQAARCTFAEIVATLEKIMDFVELGEYRDLTEQYESMRKLLLDETTLSKRNTLSARQSLAIGVTTNESTSEAAKSIPNGYHKVFSLVGGGGGSNGAEVRPEERNGGYISVQEAARVNGDADNAPPKGENGQDYVTLSQAQNLP